MSLIQILVIIFVAFTGSRTLLRFHDKAINWLEFSFWSAIWTVILVIVFNPHISDRIASTLGVERGTDVMFFIAIILLFYIIFRLYVKIDSLDKNITNIVTEVSKKLHKKQDE